MKSIRNRRMLQTLVAGVVGGLLMPTAMLRGQVVPAPEILKLRAEVQAKAMGVALPESAPASPAAADSKKGGSSSSASKVASAPPAPGLVEPAASPAASSSSAGKAPRIPSTAKVNFDFNDYDLGELLKRVSEMTGKNFILTEPLAGKKVTILSPQKITVEEAYQVFLSVLKSAGYTVAPLGKSLKVVPLASASSEPIPTVFEGGGRGEAFQTRLLTVANIDVDQVSSALGKLASPNGSIITYAPTNTLIITDTATNIERILEILQKLDVESPTEQLVMIPIRFAMAADIADKLMQVYGDESSSGGTRASRGGAAGKNQGNNNRRRNNNNAPAPGPAGGATTSLGGDIPKISKIIADERTNALIVLATEKALEDIKALVTKLDVDVDESLKSDIHVYYLSFANAEELAQTLANLAGTGSPTTGGGRTQTQRPGGTNTQTRPGQQQNNFNRPMQNSGFSGSSNFGSSQSPVAMFEGGVRITADLPTNALVITASFNDYQTLRRIIEKLDVRRRQVFVEAVILELSQDKKRDVGVSFHTGVPSGTYTSGSIIGNNAMTSLVPSDPNLLAGLAVGVFGTLMDAPTGLASGLAQLLGATSADGLQIPMFGVVLQAMQADQDVNILSTPSIMTSNNQEAKIVVGQNVPFQSGSTLSTVGSNISISREDVALTLKVTPQINDGEVTLQVFQEITEVVPGTTSSPLGPTTTKRQAETVVSLSDNQTVVIGGLISAKENIAENKIPILGDIPVIGALFRTKSKSISKSNLLIFLTPHIIESEQDMMNVYRVKMLQREEFIRRFYGKSREEQLKEMNALLMYSMNIPDVPPVYAERKKKGGTTDTIEIKSKNRGFVVPGLTDTTQSGPVIVPVGGPGAKDKANEGTVPEGGSSPTGGSSPAANDLQPPAPSEGNSPTP